MHLAVTTLDMIVFIEQQIQKYSFHQYFFFAEFCCWTYNHGHNILRLFDVWPNFPFTKHGIYELLNNLRLWILVIRKYQENLKASKNYSLKLSLPPKMNFFSILAKKPWKIEIELSLSAQFHRKTRLCLKYFVHECLWKQFFANNFPWTPLNLICLTILVTLRHLTQF